MSAHIEATLGCTSTVTPSSTGTATSKRRVNWGARRTTRLAQCRRPLNEDKHSGRVSLVTVFLLIDIRQSKSNYLWPPTHLPSSSRFIVTSSRKMYINGPFWGTGNGKTISYGRNNVRRLNLAARTTYLPTRFVYVSMSQEKPVTLSDFLEGERSEQVLFGRGNF